MWEVIIDNFNSKRAAENIYGGGYFPRRHHYKRDAVKLATEVRGIRGVDPANVIVRRVK